MVQGLMSRWDSILDTKENPGRPTCELVSLYSEIASDRHKNIIEAIRAEPDKKKRTELKKKLPVVTVSGTFSERKATGLLEHSNYICMDFDGIPDADFEWAKEKLAADRYTRVLWVTASGKGLAVVVPIPGHKHEIAFHGLADYYLTEYGLEVDASGKDICRSRYLSYDPNAVLSGQAKVFTGGKKESLKPPKYLNTIPCTNSDIGRICSKIESDITFRDYRKRLQLAFAFASIGEPGREYLHACMQHATGYSREFTDKKFNNALDTGDGRVNIATFFFIADAAGIDTGPVREKSRAVYSAVENGKRKNETYEKIAADLRTRGVLDQEDTKSGKQDTEMVKDLYDKIEIGTTAADEVDAYVTQNFPRKYNKLTQNIEIGDIGGTAMDAIINKTGSDLLCDQRARAIRLHLRKVFPKVDAGVINDAVLTVKPQDHYHPIFDKIAEIRKEHEMPLWDASELVDKFINTLKFTNTDATLERTLIRKWLLSIPQNIFKGHTDPSPLMLVFTGPQGIGKSYWNGHLLPEPLWNFIYTGSVFEGDKDCDIAMCENILVIAGEMPSPRKCDVRNTKRILSLYRNTQRKAYATTPVPQPRIATVCGDTNEADFIPHDEGGNRRILPVAITGTDREAYNAICKGELLSALMMLWESGETCHITAEEQQGLNDTLTPQATEVSELDLWIPTRLKPSEQFLPSIDIAIAFRNEGKGNTNYRAIKASMKAAGYKEARGKGDHRNIKGYRAALKNTLEKEQDLLSEID